MREARVRSLVREDPLEKEMATYSNTLAWKIPWMEEPGGLPSMVHKGDHALGEKCFIDGAPYYIHDCLDCVEDVIKGWDDRAQARWEKREKKAGYV